MKRNEKTMIGRALVKHHNQMVHQSKEKNNIYRSRERKVLESITHMKDIDVIMEQADEAENLFSSTHPGPRLVINLDSGGIFNDDTISLEMREEQKKEQQLHLDKLCIPRRPPWNAKMSVEELDFSEKQSFLKWRRDIAKLEENEKLVITPFEKNIDIWRQLWRVVERSHLLVMVVDARDPLFYRCPDLEAYCKEVNKHKKTLLLVNKADLLPPPVRRDWADYFNLHGILFAFWSAKSASALLAAKHSQKEGSENEENEENEEDEEEVKICGRDELLARLLSEVDEIAGAASTENPAVVGFVGYPNVGKSSTINALIGEKRTGVTSTPGKTKHFQTLIISDTMTLCDCPGLVFPSLASSRHDMVAAGVLPIDRMTQPRSAVRAVADRVPRHVLERVYNISLPRPASYEPQSRPPTASELIRAYCASRGHVSSRGLPDETRASRQILRDYMDGKLPHFELPPWRVDRGSSFDEGGFEPPCLEHVLSDLGRFEMEEKGGRRDARVRKSEKKASHKMHKKTPRKKDRSWRAWNDGSDGTPVVRVCRKAVNNGPFVG